MWANTKLCYLSAAGRRSREVEDGKIPGRVNLRAENYPQLQSCVCRQGGKRHSTSRSCFLLGIVWVASHSPLWPRSSLRTVAALKHLSDSVRAQDGFPAARTEVIGVGSPADIVGSRRWARVSSALLRFRFENVWFFGSILDLVLVPKCLRLRQRCKLVVCVESWKATFFSYCQI